MVAQRRAPWNGGGDHSELAGLLVGGDLFSVHDNLVHIPMQRAWSEIHRVCAGLSLHFPARKAAHSSCHESEAAEQRLKYGFKCVHGCRVCNACACCCVCLPILLQQPAVNAVWGNSRFHRYFVVLYEHVIDMLSLGLCVGTGWARYCNETTQTRPTVQEDPDQMSKDDCEGAWALTGSGCRGSRVVGEHMLRRQDADALRSLGGLSRAR